MNARRGSAWIVAITTLAWGVPVLADDGVDAIELWTRTAGQYGREPEPTRTRVVTMQLDRMPMQEGDLTDAQYGVRRKYRHIRIEELIRRYAPAPETNTALLHFSNGMAVPLPFRSPTIMQRLRPALARQVQIDGTWTRAFPPISKTDTYYFDVRPTQFAGNKVVVAELWHPSIRSETEQTFSPWRYVNALTGIEFVDDHAYLAQFAANQQVTSGARVYAEVCRFCHGARKQGAQFGWDFIEPLPISEYRKRDTSLYYHVKYRVVDATARGILMPALPFLTQQDATDLMAWLRALAAQPLGVYAPARR
jgi:hypothetical protein